MSREHTPRARAVDTGCSTRDSGALKLAGSATARCRNETELSLYPGTHLHKVRSKWSPWMQSTLSMHVPTS